MKYNVYHISNYVSVDPKGNRKCYISEKKCSRKDSS